MSWGAYAIPLLTGLKTFATFLPGTYSKYSSAPKSTYSLIVEGVAKRVLNNENRDGATYQERIREMIEELPSSVAERNIDALVATRLNVVSVKDPAMPIHSTGTDFDIVDIGKFFIAIDPEISAHFVEALRWISAHEICHLLEGDWPEILGVKTVASLSVTVLSTFVFGWTLLPSVGAACLANIVTHVIMSHRAENRADDFANKHCTQEEREKAITFLEHVKDSKPQGIFASFRKLLLAAFHPSEEARIAKIRSTLNHS